MYAILILYREILDREIDVEEVNPIRSEKPERLLVVLSRSETKQIILFFKVNISLSSNFSMAAVCE